MFDRVLENTYTEGTHISVDTQQNGHPEAGRADDVVARTGLDDPARDPLAEIAPFEVQLETRVDPGARDGVESPCCDEGLVEVDQDPQTPLHLSACVKRNEHFYWP